MICFAIFIVLLVGAVIWGARKAGPSRRHAAWTPVGEDKLDTGPVDIGGPTLGQPPRIRKVVMRPATGDCDCEPGCICRASHCPRFVSHIRTPHSAQSQHQPRGR